MPNKIVLIVIAVLIVCAMLFGNKKVRVLPVLMKQLQVFKNAKTNKISIWDIICFVILPIALAVLIAIGFGCVIDPMICGVCMVMLATPVASMAAMLAQQYDGNYALAAKGVALTTILSVVTMPVVAAVLGL